MTRAPRRVALAVLLAAAVAGSGCAAHWAYRQGEEASANGDWDLAVARYTKALEKDTKNIGYKIALENARIQASRLHYDKAREHLAASDFEKAVEELEIATKYDPANRSAADDLQILRERIRKRDEERQQRAAFEQTRARAQAAARVPLPVLSPRSPVPITMRFEEGSLQKILESLGRIAGVNVLFDEGFRDKKASVNLSGISFQEALDRITFVNRLFYKVLDQNTIIIVPESRQKRTSYDELLLRTFYVQNAEINDTVNLVKTLAKVQTVAGNQALNAITVLGTVDQLAMAERIIDANDKARGEVLVEVRILEVNRNNLKRWGIDLSNYTAALTLSPTGAENEITAGLLNIRAHLLSSLNQADWVVSIPSTVFARFLETDSNVRILASPRLRAAEGKKAELKIGTEVPIPVTSYTVGTGGGNTGYLPATSFQYRNVGVNLTLEPRVAASGDITMQMTAEFSLLGDDRNVGSESNPINVPTFLSRNVTGTLRLRDGETGLIGGLLLGRDSRSFSGALGISSVPVIGKLFGNNQRSVDESEVLISITPRIVRAPKVTEDDMIPMRVGTQEVPKVEGLRGSLFAEPEPAPQTAPPAGVPPQPPASGSGAPSTTPRPLAAPNGPAVPQAPNPAPPSAPPLDQPIIAPPAPAVTPPPAAAPDGSSASAPAAPAGETRPATAILSPPEVVLQAGQTGALAIVLVGARDVLGVELTVAWDATLAEVTDISAGSLLSLEGVPVSAERAIEAGRARVRFTRATGVTGSGAIAALTLRGVRAGSGSVVVESLSVVNTQGSRPVAPPAAGRLAVSP